MSSPGRVVLGVDGGNTKTIALIARLDGTIVGWARSGSTDIHDAPGAAAAIIELRRAITDACVMAGAAPDDIAHAVLGLAGADCAEDADVLGAGIDDLITGPAVILNDAINAIRCGTPDGIGVSVVCGTGGAAAAVNAAGGAYFQGQWPEASGGRELGRQGLAVLEDSGADGELAERARRFAGGTDERAFAPDVLAAARQGDTRALRIVHDQGRILGAQARICAERVGFSERFPLVLAGGVLRDVSPELRAAILAEVPGATLIEAACEPAVAAVLRCFDAMGADVAPAVLSSAPPAALFATA